MTTMYDNDAPVNKDRHTDDAEQIAIDARDVLAGRWDDVRMEASR